MRARALNLEDLGRAARIQPQPVAAVAAAPPGGWPRPLSDHVLIEDLGPIDRPATEGGRTGAMLWQAPDWKEMPREGRVLAVGPGQWAEDEEGNQLGYRVALSVKPSDRVLYGRYAGRRTWILSADPRNSRREFIVMEESAILGWLD